MLSAGIRPWLYTVMVKVTSSPVPTMALWPLPSSLTKAKSNGLITTSSGSESSSSVDGSGSPEVPVPSPPIVSSEPVLTSPPASLPGVSSGVESISSAGKPSLSVKSLISATFTSCVPLLRPPSTVRMMSIVVDAPGAKPPAGSSPALTSRVVDAPLATAAQAGFKAALNVKPLGT